METVGSITAKLCDLSMAVESIDRQLIQLFCRKSDLQQLQTDLRTRLRELESQQSLADWQVGQRMTIDLLRSEVGEDVFQIE